MSNNLARKSKKTSAPQPLAGPVKLDLGCGPNKREGFLGVDCRSFDGKVDVVTDLRTRWPWEDNSIDEVVASHFVEHLDAQERIHFANELYRVLKPGAKAQIVVPHWASCRAYGDLTHKWPPVSEFWFYYLDRPWREANAPHNDFYTCDFSITWGNVLHESLRMRAQDYQAHAQAFWKEAIQDIVATFVKKPVG